RTRRRSARRRTIVKRTSSINRWLAMPLLAVLAVSVGTAYGQGKLRKQGAPVPGGAESQGNGAEGSGAQGPGQGPGPAGGGANEEMRRRMQKGGSRSGPGGAGGAGAGMPQEEMRRRMQGSQSQSGG